MSNADLDKLLPYPERGESIFKFSLILDTLRLPLSILKFFSNPRKGGFPGGNQVDGKERKGTKGGNRRFIEDEKVNKLGRALESVREDFRVGKHRAEWSVYVPSPLPSVAFRLIATLPILFHITYVQSFETPTTRNNFQKKKRKKQETCSSLRKFYFRCSFAARYSFWKTQGLLDYRGEEGKHD